MMERQGAANMDEFLSARSWDNESLIMAALAISGFYFWNRGGGGSNARRLGGYLFLALFMLGLKIQVDHSDRLESECTQGDEVACRDIELEDYEADLRKGHVR